MDIDAVDWVRSVDGMGADEILLTGMGRDGTNDGYDLSMTRAICDAVNVPVIASGVAANPEHMLEAFENTGADVVLFAGIFHRGVVRK